MTVPPTPSSRIVLHYYVLTLRLLSVFSLVAVVTYHHEYSRPSLPLFLMTGVLLSLNDIFMITVDFWRTDTYVGCVLSQVFLSVASIVTIVLATLKTKNYNNHFAVHITVITFCTLSVSCSILLLVLNSHSHVWVANTKDVLVDDHSAFGNPRLTWKGHPRSAPLSAVRVPLRFPPIRWFFLTLFLRRVSPAETKPYALVRNTFAVFSVAALVWRATTALSQAQNRFETHIVSRDCPEFWSNATAIQVFFGDPPDENNFIEHRLNVTMSGNSGGDKVQCLQDSSSYVSEDGQVFTVYTCPNATDLFPAKLHVRFDITIQSLGGIPLEPRHMPWIWLSNKTEYYNNTLAEKGLADVRLGTAVHWFTPTWQLSPGIHLEAEAVHSIRRFVSTSIFHDVIAQREPLYDEISLYPINTKTMRIIDGNASATASVLLSSRQEYPFFQDRENLQAKVGTHRNGICSYIEDYRSSTVFDIIGSIGGLFALLQSLHMLLFGRPMLWGFTGAKLITPFGLLGALSTRGFKRRLREQYHRSEPGPSSDSANRSETIRMEAFLRDFVIDFGPADVVDVRDSSKHGKEPQTIAELSPHRANETLVRNRQSHVPAVLALRIASLTPEKGMQCVLA